MFSLRVLLSFCLIFWQFQPGVAYKNVAYKKACKSRNKTGNSLYLQRNNNRLKDTLQMKIIRAAAARSFVFTSSFSSN